ncbi:MAG: hypothetical protein HFG49_13460 [Lachnospiraceae bacterium]|nr:hypothetical protein [Lachnospiraceae bacterium]
MYRKRVWKMPLRDPVSAQLSDGALSFHSKVLSSKKVVQLHVFTSGSIGRKPDAD